MNREELAAVLREAGGDSGRLADMTGWVFASQRDRLIDAIDRLDEECGELEPHVRDAIDRFILTIWEVF